MTKDNLEDRKIFESSLAKLQLEHATIMRSGDIVPNARSSIEIDYFVMEGVRLASDYLGIPKKVFIEISLKAMLKQLIKAECPDIYFEVYSPRQPSTQIRKD